MADPTAPLPAIFGSAPVVAAPSATTADRVGIVDDFRALAIIGVVTGHSYLLAWGSYRGAPSALDFIANMITGSTALFVFISGFMFQYVFASRYEYGTFLAAKVRTVFLPYAVVSLALMLMFGGNHTTVMIDQTIGQIDDFYMRYALALVMGNTGPSMWYVPFIAIFFLASPLFRLFQKQSLPVQSVLLFAALIIGVTVNRAPYNVDKFQNVAYFLFFYMAGILCAQNFDIVMGALRSRLIVGISLGAAIVLAIIQVEFVNFGGTAGPWFAFTHPDIHYLQKIILCIAVPGLCLWFRGTGSKWLKSVAEDSFGIFFLHNLVLILLGRAFGAGAFTTGFKMLDLFFWASAVLFMTHALVRVLKHLIGRKSRMFIGA